MSSAESLPSSPEHSAAPQYPIESVDNALRLLWLIGERQSLRLTDASQYLGVASSTAHRVLAMLQYRGFVKQNPATRAYEAGPALDRIAFSVLRRLDIRERARPVLERLNAEVGETVHLGQLEGQKVHFIDSIESTRAVRVGSRLGRSMPAHCTSTGKAMLAQLSDTQLFALYPEEHLEQLTPQSIASREELVEALDEVRKRGYATSREESEEEVSSVAISLSAGPTPLMALNVSVPTNRMTATARKKIVEKLRQAAEEINTLVR